MAGALSSLYGAGALLVAAALALPGWSGRSEIGLAVPALVASLTALGVWWRRERLIERHGMALVVLGSVLIALAARAAGPASSSVALYFVWVSLFSFYFFPCRSALAEWTVSALANAAILVGEETWSLGVARWIITSGTSLAAGVVVGQLVRRIGQLAMRDWLTGTLNRRAWDTALETARSHASRSGRPMTVVLVDLDHFKSLNDRDGHAAGDAALRDVAAAWQQRLRADDTLARLGGDEFGVVLAGCAIDEALQVVETIRQAGPGGLTCSVGLASWDGSESIDVLLQRADAALYRAKAAGRDRIVAADIPITTS